MKHRHFFVLSKRAPNWYFVLLLLTGMLIVSPAVADNIGINFVGGSKPRGTPQPIKPDELAGLFVQKFWNNAYEKSGTLSPVGDDEKGSSISYPGFSVTWAAFQTNAKPMKPSGGPPDHRLGVGYLDAIGKQPATVTFSSIPDPFTGEGRSYSLVVYFSLDNIDFKNRTSGDKVNIFTLKGAKAGERTICGLQPSGEKPPLASWVEVSANSTTDEGEKTSAGNYVVFANLTDKDITLTATGGFASDGDSRAAINAVQIIPNVPRASPTPEK